MVIGCILKEDDSLEETLYNPIDNFNNEIFQLMFINFREYKRVNVCNKKKSVKKLFNKTKIREGEFEGKMCYPDVASRNVFKFAFIFSEISVNKRHKIYDTIKTLERKNGKFGYGKILIIKYLQQIRNIMCFSMNEDDIEFIRRFIDNNNLKRKRITNFVKNKKVKIC